MLIYKNDGFLYYINLASHIMISQIADEIMIFIVFNSIQVILLAVYTLLKLFATVVNHANRSWFQLVL